YQNIKNYINLNDLNKEIILTGWIPHHQIPEYFQNVDVAIHHVAQPYMSPLKIFEYMAMGKPVIGPDTPGVREIFTELEILMVKPFVEDIFKKMEFLFNNKEKRIELTHYGKKLVERKYQ